jgi:hypothetical protein
MARCGLALVLSACGCGGGGDSGPMSGQQLLAGRDFANLGFWNGRTLEFTRDTADQPPIGPQDLWEWPLDEAGPAAALNGIDWRQFEPMPRRRVGALLATGWQLERLYDVESGQSENLFAHFSGTPPDGASDGSGGARISPYTYTALRSDGGAIARVRWDINDEIVVGRPGELRTFAMPGGGSIGGIAFVGADLAVLRAQGGTDGAPIGIDRLDTSSGAVTPLVPATPAAEWKGVAGWCQEALELCGSFGAVGCAVDEPPCENGRQPCSIYYAKVDPDDATKTALYVHDVRRSVTTKLLGANPELVRANDQSRALVWGFRSPPAIRHLDLCSGTEWVCPFQLPPGFNLTWRPDSGGFVIYSRGFWLSIVDVAGEMCTQPTHQAAYDANWAVWSPAGDRLMWVAGDGGATTETMWLANADGTSPIPVAHGSSLLGSFSADGRILYATHYETSTVALGWVDVAALPMTENILSSNTGGTGMRDGRRALFIDHFNSQDGYGDLVLVELATGVQRLLARSVTDVAVLRDSDGEEHEVAYAVKGRASSARDGLWLTKLPP